MEIDEQVIDVGLADPLIVAIDDIRGLGRVAIVDIIPEAILDPRQRPGVGAEVVEHRRVALAAVGREHSRRITDLEPKPTRARQRAVGRAGDHPDLRSPPPPTR